MPSTITFEDAYQNGAVKIGDYFVTTASKDAYFIAKKELSGYKEDQEFQIRAGEQKLWRLEKGLKMWGEPTSKRLTLVGREGLMHGPNIMNDLVTRLYNVLPDVFKNVQACSLPEMDYILHEEVKIVELQVSMKYQNNDDKNFKYWLASRYSEIREDYAKACIFYVYNGHIYVGWLFDSNNYVNELAYSVRPEATPNPKLILNTDGCDGTKRKPWILL